MPWRYRPKDNRTPVNHPLFGHLEWNTIVEDDRAAGDPGFTHVKDADPAGDPTPAPAAEPENTPAKAPGKAGKPGRSK